ncbi:MAG: hypothetical protein J7518_10815 [Nocardioidaceae bacterium]|nr:hypothetical protein [Nocardioidaceae bacterium]
MEKPPPPSLTIVRAEVDRHVAEAERAGSEVDSRAGLIVGFGGVFIGLSRELQNLLQAAAVVVAGLAVLAAVVALWPRSVAEAVGARTVRDRYLAAPADVTTRDLLDARIFFLDLEEKRLNRKTAWAKFSVVAIAVSAVLMLAGSIVELAS